MMLYQKHDDHNELGRFNIVVVVVVVVLSYIIFKLKRCRP